ncbi:hypothetical protein KGQ72_01150 [Patescibacteria group bacterium]|nr:hypothetical protein [Patescibacteria group bacterium]
MLQETDIQKSVLEKIHAGAVTMHSRVFFVLRTVLAGVVALLILAGALFALSFLFFHINQSGARFLLGFGNRGLMTFIALFPWASLLLALVLLVALELVVRHFTPVYRFSLIRIFLWLAGIGIVGSALIGLTPLHASLLSAADNNQLPLLGPIYTQVHRSHHAQGVYRGYVTSVAESTFVMSHNDTDRDSDEGTWTVQPPQGFNLATLSVGEKMYVAGRLQNGIVHAYGVRRVPN